MTDSAGMFGSIVAKAEIDADEESEFLANYYRFVPDTFIGVADELAALLTSSGCSVATRVGLFGRLYGEMFAASETLLAWIAALRFRPEVSPGVLPLLINYRSEVGKIEKLLEEQSDLDLLDLARLPDPNLVAAGIARLPRGSFKLSGETVAGRDIGRLMVAWVRDAKATLDLLRDVVTIRIRDERALTTVHNKIKHGLPFVPDLERAATDTYTLYVSETSYATTTIEPANIEKYRHNTSAIAKTIRTVSIIAHISSVAGRLYPPEE